MYLPIREMTTRLLKQTLDEYSNEIQEITFSTTSHLGDYFEKVPTKIEQILETHGQNVLPKILRTLPDLIRGRVLLALGESQKAKRYFNKNTNEQPHNFFAWNDLGVCHLQGDKPTEAAYCFFEAIKLLDKIPVFWDNAGEALSRLGLHEEAQKCLENSLDIDPNNAMSQNKLGIIYLKNGEFEKAQKCLEKAVEVDPKNSLFLNNLTTFYQRTEGQNRKTSDDEN